MYQKLFRDNVFKILISLLVYLGIAICIAMSEVKVGEKVLIIIMDLIMVGILVCAFRIVNKEKFWIHIKYEFGTFPITVGLNVTTLIENRFSESVRIIIYLISVAIACLFYPIVNHEIKKAKQMTEKSIK